MKLTEIDLHNDIENVSVSEPSLDTDEWEFFIIETVDGEYYRLEISNRKVIGIREHNKYFDWDDWDDLVIRVLVQTDFDREEFNREEFDELVSKDTYILIYRWECWRTTKKRGHYLETYANYYIHKDDFDKIILVPCDEIGDDL